MSMQYGHGTDQHINKKYFHREVCRLESKEEQSTNYPLQQTMDGGRR